MQTSMYGFMSGWMIIGILLAVFVVVAIVKLLQKK